MDEIVRQAMAKWPNVPHCHGWLALDARGVFRMRDEATQARGLPGDPIRNAALLSFIHRNYTCDERGAWYFQNGPQRVYVDLEATPFIARTDPQAAQSGLVLHDGQPFSPQQIWMTPPGQLVLKEGERIAMLDDRDLGQVLENLRCDGGSADEPQLLAWLENPQARLTLDGVALQPLDATTMPQTLGYVARPRPTEQS